VAIAKKANAKKSLRGLPAAGVSIEFTTNKPIATVASNAPAADNPMPSCCSSMTVTPVAATNTNGIPDLLKTCPVSGEKLGGDMGGPYVFSYQGQEVKLCCRSCKKDFDKSPDKYLKLIRAADKK
jgi:YHS domain-containing protein